MSVTGLESGTLVVVGVSWLGCEGRTGRSGGKTVRGKSVRAVAGAGRSRRCGWQAADGV